MSSETADKALYSISRVSEMTGVNAITLRAWERRYGLIKPIRTVSGHRMYSTSDIEHIKKILQLLDEGIAISRVSEAMDKAREEGVKSDHQGPWQEYLDTMVKATHNFDEGELETVYNEAMSLYPVDIVMRNLLLPLIHHLGEKWMKEDLGIAEEHFFSVFMRNKLGARFHHRNLHNTGPTIVAACLPGELHEFGLLMFSLSAHARGYRIVLLGANMPLEQIEDVVQRTQSSAVVLSGAESSVDEQLVEDIECLARSVKVPVFVGGSYSKVNSVVIEEAGAIPLGDDLIVGLHQIGKEVGSVEFIKNKTGK